VTPWERRPCGCGRLNRDHEDSDLDEHGNCLRVGDLPSRPAFDVVVEDGTAPVRLALASMCAADNEDGDA
jgi:hypothetical protein